MNDARSIDQRREDLRRILRNVDLPDRPRHAERVVGALILLGLACLVAVATISWAARLGDDVRATRTAVERPCRP